MKKMNIISVLTALAVGLMISGCGSIASNTGQSNSTSTANKANTTTSAANSAPAAKQGTPPKADFTVAVEDLHKEYKTLFAKNPQSIADKYENKNIQITGKITRTYPVTTGTGIETNVGLKGAGSTDDDAACIFTPQTEESLALKEGDTVTLIGMQTHNSNGETPRLEKCFVIKVGP